MGSVRAGAVRSGEARRGEVVEQAAGLGPAEPGRAGADVVILLTRE